MRHSNTFQGKLDLINAFSDESGVVASAYYEKNPSFDTALVSSIEDDDFARAADCIGRLRETGGKVILIGNGGSAAICSHLAVDFTKSAGIRAISFSDPSLQTCFSNDYGYESAYAEMVDAYGDAGDVLIAISSSGSSANIVNATQKASALGISLITLSGFGDGNPLRS